MRAEFPQIAVGKRFILESVGPMSARMRLAADDRHLRPGGLLVTDNVLWDGQVANPSATDEQTELIRAFNAALQQDDRVDLALIPIADGLTVARVR